MSAKTKQRRKRPLNPRTQVEGPTPERLLRAAEGDGFVKNEDRIGLPRVYTIMEPLDRMLERKSITSKQYAALDKFRIHWHNAGLLPNCKSIDLNRIYAAGESGAGMPATERQAFHRLRYRDAVQAMGMRVSRTVELVTCHGYALHEAGKLAGWDLKPQAVAVATDHLRNGGDSLAVLWGM